MNAPLLQRDELGVLRSNRRAGGLPAPRAISAAVIGERPGLSVADSLGVYLTHDPKPGRTDAERNCVSNIHPPGGLGYDSAARVVAGLVDGARRLGRSGVELKDTSRAVGPGETVAGSVAGE